MTYDQIWAGLTESPWAILPAKMQEILDVVAARRAGQEALTPEAFAARFGEGATLREPISLGSVRVIPIQGVIAQKITLMQRMSGGTSTEQVGGWLDDALADDAVSAIVFDVDSPGGSVAGLEELAAKIFASRQKKRSVAVANTLMASAAYYLASQATEVVGSPSALVGSIGTILTHAESSASDAKWGVKYSVISAGKHKADANAVEPLTDQGRATLQKVVDDYYAQFVAAVARGRGTTSDAVRNGYGEGQVLIAEAALAAKLVDRVASLEQVLAELRAPAATAGLRQSIVTPPATAQAAAAVPPTLGASTMTHHPAASAPPAAPPAPPANGPANGPGNGGNPPPTGAAAPPVAGPEGPKPDEVAAAAIRQERARVEAIHDAGRVLGLGEELIAQAISDGVSIDQFRASAIGALKAKHPPVDLGGRIQQHDSERDVFARAAEHALLLRANHRAAIEGDLATGAQELAGKRLLDLAAESMVRCGVDRRVVAGLSNEALAKQALSLPTMFDGGVGILAGVAYHTTGSFPQLVLNVSQKALARGFEEAPVTFRAWCTRGPNMNDFRPGQIIKFGESPDLEMVPEGQEPTEAKFTDDREVIIVDRYVKQFSVTFQMILSDDLSALNQVPRRMAEAAARTLNKLIYRLLVSNPTMRDGYALFDATNHQGNDKTVSAGAPTVAQLGALNAILRLMNGLNSDTPLNLSLRYVLVPAALETAARQLLMSVADPADNKSSEVKNPFYGLIQPIADAELDLNSNVKWYGVADPSMIDTIQYRYLQGQETPVQTSWYEPGRATRHIQVEQSFGAAVAEYRGLVRNAGQ